MYNVTLERSGERKAGREHKVIRNPKMLTADLKEVGPRADI